MGPGGQAPGKLPLRPPELLVYSLGMESEEARISLEEKVAFLEREAEHLRAELGEAWKAIGALQKQAERFARSLESRDEESDPAE